MLPSHLPSKSRDNHAIGVHLFPLLSPSCHILPSTQTIVSSSRSLWLPTPFNLSLLRSSSFRSLFNYVMEQKLDFWDLLQWKYIFVPCNDIGTIIPPYRYYFVLSRTFYVSAHASKLPTSYSPHLFFVSHPSQFVDFLTSLTFMPLEFAYLQHHITTFIYIHSHLLWLALFISAPSN